MREIRFYRSAAGHCPVEAFLDTLSGKQAQKIAWTLQLIEEMPVVPVQYFKKLVNTEDLWEVRVLLAGNAFRLLGFFDGPNMVVLNHAFAKKSQKTPKSAIEIATQRKHDYFRRKNIHE